MVISLLDTSWFPISIIFFFTSFFLLKRVLENIQIADFERKAVCITGCDSGFGQEAALKFSRLGFLVYAGCRTEEGLRSIENDAEVQKFPGRVIGILLDITSDESVEEAAKFVRDDLPADTKLWCLLNNAGVFSTYGPAEWCSIDEYQTAMDVNFFGAVRCTRSFLPLIKQSKGRIGFTSTISGRLGTPFATPYSSAKFALTGFAEALFGELSAFGIQVGLFEPGIFKTPLLSVEAQNDRVESVWQKMPEELREEYGNDYKQKFLEQWNKVLTASASSNTYQVTDSYVDFTTSRFPRFRYACGWDAKLFWIPLSVLPTDWTRKIWSHGLENRPAAVQKNKYN